MLSRTRFLKYRRKKGESYISGLGVSRYTNGKWTGDLYMELYFLNNEIDED